MFVSMRIQIDEFDMISVQKIGIVTQAYFTSLHLVISEARARQFADVTLLNRGL